MSISYFMYALSNTAFFSSRAFLPAFVTALILRFPDAVPFLHLNLRVSENMQWFISDEMLITLGVLSALEIWADKNPGLRDFLDQVDSFVKAIVMVGTSLAVLDSDALQIFRQMERSGLESGVVYAAAGAPVAVQSSSVLMTAWTVLCAALIFVLNALRKQALHLVRLVDENNDIGLVSFFSWVEDAWVFLGVLFLFILPTFTFIVVGIALVMLFLITKYLQRMEEKVKVDCPVCHTRISPSALECPSCRTPLAQPDDVNLLGFPQKKKAADRRQHALKLLSVKRCPSCSGRLPERSILQSCPACHNPGRSNAAEIREYASYVEKRFSHALLLSFVAGFVPVFGAIFALIYSNLLLVRPFSQYVYLWKGLWLRWLTRLAIFVLVVLQPIPLIGYVTCPVIVLIYYTTWKLGFERTYASAQTAPRPLPVKEEAKNLG